MDKTFQITPHRGKILTTLLAGAIEDPSGHATPMLQEHTGHRTTNALAAVLLQLENAGLIQRDMNGRRTYRIALTQEGQRVARGLSNGSAPDAPPALDPAATAIVDGAVDLDLLAGILLKKALIATQAQEDSAGSKEAVARAARAEARLATLEDELRELRDEAALLRAQVKTLEHNNTVLTNQMDKVRKNPGTPIKELISRTELRNLDQLMRALPGGGRG